jgi:hypothetical protein
MAILRINEIEEIVIRYYDIDNCGDILYAYQFLYDGRNVINSEILYERNKDGIFIVTDCDFEKCEVISFFDYIIKTKNSLNYENIEPPVIHIHCRAWNELKDNRIKIWENARHPDGTSQYKEGFIESMSEFWEKDVELTFSLDSIFTINREKYSLISLHYKTTTDNLQEFVNELKSEFQDFKSKNLQKHLKNSK